MNSSSIDFVTTPISIYATSYEERTGVFSRIYNSRNYTIGNTELHNFNNGYTTPNSGAVAPC